MVSEPSRAPPRERAREKGRQEERRVEPVVVVVVRLGRLVRVRPERRRPHGARVQHEERRQRERDHDHGARDATPRALHEPRERKHREKRLLARRRDPGQRRMLQPQRPRNERERHEIVETARRKPRDHGVRHREERQGPRVAQRHQHQRIGEHGRPAVVDERQLQEQQRRQVRVRRLPRVRPLAKRRRDRRALGVERRVRVAARQDVRERVRHVIVLVRVRRRPIQRDEDAGKRHERDHPPRAAHAPRTTVNTNASTGARKPSPRRYGASPAKLSSRMRATTGAGKRSRISNTGRPADMPRQ